MDYTNENRAKLKDLLAKHPRMIVTYWRRPDGSYVDLPVGTHTDNAITNHPDWKLESSNQTMDDDVHALFQEPSDFDSQGTPKTMEQIEQEHAVPPKPSEKKRGRPKKSNA